LRSDRTAPDHVASAALSDLTPDDRALVVEEEALLAKVQTALLARRTAGRGEGDLVGRLKELREEALEATAKDLPTLFTEMSYVRAVMERKRVEALPDAAAPYFGHLRVREAGEVRDYLLGRATFVDRPAGVRVVDWRYAPIASLFYRYREGEEYEEPFPGRVSEGVIEVRRIVVLERGVLTRIQAGHRMLVRGAEGRWRVSAGAALGGGAGSAARPGALGVGAGARDRVAGPDVTALLDPEQFEALSLPADRPLLVLGSAGSGKTTVALHRLARLAFEDAKRYPAARMQVVVPEVGLARLTARLLEPLGLSKVAVRTLDAWARGAFQSALGVPPPRVCGETPALVARLKRHPALYETLRRRPRLAGAHAGLRRLRQDLSDLLVDRAFLESVVRAASGDLPTTAIEETVRHTRLQLAPPAEEALAGFDPERIETLDGRPISEGTPESVAGTLDPEDLPLLLFLWSRESGSASKRIAHLVVDEAEDVSLFELDVMGRLLGGGRSVTVAGDESQQTFSSYAGWPQALAALGVAGAATCRLETTYRCPAPVAALAHAVLGPLAPPAPPRAGRPGVPVSRFDFPSEAHAQLFVAGAIRELVEREPQASVGVIANAPDTARAIHRLLSDLPEVRVALDGRFTFRPGVDVTDVASVKGLEFDYVVVPDASARAYPDSDDARRRLHVAVTRAAHQLWIAAPGTPSPLLRGLAVA
jgi:DNA helicase II / ATP-dependent DNA helicase PcrA